MPTLLESRQAATNKIGSVGLVPPDRSVPAQYFLLAMRRADACQRDWLPKRRYPPPLEEEDQLHQRPPLSATNSAESGTDTPSNTQDIFQDWLTLLSPNCNPGSILAAEIYFNMAQSRRLRAFIAAFHWVREGACLYRAAALDRAHRSRQSIITFANSS